MEEFMKKLSGIKYIKKNENTKTYEANMKILIKQIKTKNEIELFYYKNKLNKTEKKIYDIIEDNNNNLYIIYDINENIDELINNNIKEKKEAIMKDQCEPIKKKEIINLFKKEESMCKIKFKKIINNKLEDMNGTGFFLKLNNKDIPFNKCLITNNHILDDNYFKINNDIKIINNNKEKLIKIKKKEILY